MLEKTISVSQEDLVSEFVHCTVDLSKWEGRIVDLRVTTETDPGRAPVALLAHPIIRSRTSSANRWNVILISLDTLRADRLSCYGYDTETSPHLDRLASEGIRFARAISPCSWTRPSHATILSGQSPLIHAVGGRGTYRRIDLRRTPMLAVDLRASGYLTAAFTEGSNVDPGFGFGAGFDRYDTRLQGTSDPDGRNRVADVVKWMERRRKGPFFLFVHSYMVHNYRPDPQYLERIGRPGLDIPTEPLKAVRRCGKTVDQAMMRILSHAYDATVLQADDQIVRPILEAVRSLALEDRTVVCVASDHGEEFLEHGASGHGVDLFREITHVPWILRYPGCPRGEVVHESVSTESIAPTLRALVGLPQDARAKAW